MTIEYRSSMLNVVMSTLRKKAQLVVLKEEEEEFPTSGGIHIHILDDLHERIKKGLEHDHMTKNIMV
jgi:hypothetical protein